MRKPRDYDAELKALGDKARQLKERKLHQLGELVIATGADALPAELLAGALIAAVDTKDAAIRESWRKRGAAFFLRGANDTTHNTRRDPGGAAKSDGATASPGSQASEN